MKKLLLVLLLISNTFAGDMYLMCEDADGDNFESAYIMEGPATVEFTDTNLYGSKIEYSITATMGDHNVFSITRRYVGSNRDPKTYTVITSSWGEDFRVSDNMSCALRD